MALLTLLGAALIVALSQRGDDRAPSTGSALGPSVVGGVAAAQPFNYVPAQRAAYERDAALGLSHVLREKTGHPEGTPLQDIFVKVVGGNTERGELSWVK